MPYAEQPTSEFARSMYRVRRRNIREIVRGSVANGMPKHTAYEAAIKVFTKPFSTPPVYYRAAANSIVAREFDTDVLAISAQAMATMGAGAPATALRLFSNLRRAAYGRYLVGRLPV